jgi:hypothetical protein
MPQYIWSYKPSSESNSIQNRIDFEYSVVLDEDYISYRNKLLGLVLFPVVRILRNAVIVYSDAWSFDNAVK